MVNYQCMSCKKDISHEEVKRRVRCPHCGSKILFKPQTARITVEAI